jgi:hypothetical protein
MTLMSDNPRKNYYVHTVLSMMESECIPIWGTFEWRYAMQTKFYKKSVLRFKFISNNRNVYMERMTHMRARKDITTHKNADIHKCPDQDLSSRPRSSNAEDSTLFRVILAE